MPDQSNINPPPEQLYGELKLVDDANFDVHGARFVMDVYACECS
jgi:hypothetical protein